MMTPQGFFPKTERDIREDIIVACQLIQDPDTGAYPLFNIGDDTVLSQVIGIFANALGTAWAELGEVYAQFDPQMNTGAGQSGTVQLNAITRKPGYGSRIEVSLTGTPGTVVKMGSLIGNLGGTQIYSIDNDSVINPLSEPSIATATATTFDPFDPPAGSINVIQSPQAGWQNVKNIRTIAIGVFEETDATLRKRQQRSTALTSYRQIEAIWAAILDIDTVTYARVYQNEKTSPIDARGIPFKEVAAVVEGGKDENIAEVLFYRLPTGQLGHGSTTVNFTDKQGIQYPISFSRPLGMPIYIKLVLKIYDSIDWPSNGVDQIKQAIIDYAEYNVGDGEVGFPPGTDVIRSRLYTPINSVQGHSILSLSLSLDGEAYKEEDIPIEWNQLALFLPENIFITLSW